MMWATTLYDVYNEMAVELSLIIILITVFLEENLFYIISDGRAAEESIEGLAALAGEFWRRGDLLCKLQAEYFRLSLVRRSHVSDDLTETNGICAAVIIIYASFYNTFISSNI